MKAQTAFGKLLYAHRGAPLRVPENTLESFREGLHAGANALELDVRITKDDVVVVFHDADGQRLVGVDKPIAKMSFAEVQSWDVGSRFNATNRGHYVYRVPKLSDVIEAFPNTILNVDIKDNSLRAVSLVIEIIRKHNATKRATLTSFDRKTLTAARALRYEGLTGSSRLDVAMAYGLPLKWFSPVSWKANAVQVPLSSGPFRFDTERFIKRCHALGARVDFWTINDAKVARRLFEMGADGVMTDDPALIKPVFVAYEDSSKIF